jgi:hypothetical protein
MAETKRITDTYTITAPTIIIDGNLTVQGTTTSVETVNSEITDNIILLNDNETGAGITLGTSGIEIDRGSLTNVSFVYDDSVDAFRALEGTGLTNIRAKTPVPLDDDNTVATKIYVDTAAGGAVTSAAGVENSVQFNTGDAFDGDSNLLYDGTSLTVGNTAISTGAITVDDTNGNLELSANGSGTVYVRSVVRLENESSDPTGIAGSNQLYAKTVGNGGSGVYFSNTDNTSDELASRRKAIIFGIIF